MNLDGYWSDVFTAEFSAALTVRKIRNLGHNAICPEYVLFRHAPPKDIAAYEEEFGSSVHFNQDSNAVTYAKDACIVSQYSTDLIPQFERSSPSAHNKTPSRQQIDKLLKDMIHKGNCSLDLLAQRCDIPRRSLQRHLSRQGTSYQTVYDEARLHLILGYLSNSSLPISAISEILCFQNTSSFTRFVKHHTGHSPTNLRTTNQKP